ncbi:hypothetical protein ETC03_12235 [Geobacillus sp. MMMUD3]|nr:hypothetical protein [Geobacillus sp. MMMUD3]
MLYQGIFDSRCWCGNYVHTHGVLCADCAAQMDAKNDDDDVVVCAGCGSPDDGYGFANGTCSCCGSGVMTTLKDYKKKGV